MSGEFRDRLIRSAWERYEVATLALPATRKWSLRHRRLRRERDAMARRIVLLEYQQSRKGRLIPADELTPVLREVWDWALSMVPGSGNVSTYGCDAVGRCIEVVERWPDADWRTYINRPPDRH